MKETQLQRDNLLSSQVKKVMNHPKIYSGQKIQIKIQQSKRKVQTIVGQCLQFKKSSYNKSITIEYKLSGEYVTQIIPLQCPILKSIEVL